MKSILNFDVEGGIERGGREKEREREGRERERERGEGKVSI